jgi:hypothetical protein
MGYKEFRKDHGVIYLSQNPSRSTGNRTPSEGFARELGDETSARLGHRGHLAEPLPEHDREPTAWERLVADSAHAAGRIR